jgi:hypothetical protein
MLQRIIEFFRRLRDAIRVLREKEGPQRTPASRPAPFCTVCGERTRPWDPNDEQRHAHNQQDARQN